MADRAVELDPEDAAGYAARGYIKALISAPSQEVISDFRRAGELQPNDASVASWSARALMIEGRSEEALFEAERAVILDPISAPRHLAVAYLSLRLGQYDRAVESARRSSALEPELALSRAIEARALLLRGDAEQCLAIDLGPHAALRATCLWEAGDFESARAIADSVTSLVVSEQERSDDFTHAVRLEDLAVFHAWQGHTPESLEWVKRAYDLSPNGVELRVYGSALFDRVRTDQFATEVEVLREDLYQRVRRTGL